MNALTTIDLKPFCADATRSSISLPFHEEVWTYATNGRIIIRVPHREDITEVPDRPPTISKSPLKFNHDEIAGWEPLPENIPPLHKETCEACGNGTESKEYCDECDGEGEFDLPESVPVGNKLLANIYLLLIKTLPNPMLAPNATGPLEVCPFKFDGGVGLLMPIKKD
jgi:hypothetical protein